ELAEAGVGARPTAHARAGVVLSGPARAGLALAHARPQGEASQLVADLVGASAGERIADLCAAPGGKSGALAEALEIAGPGGLVVAADRTRAGMRRVAALARGGPDGSGGRRIAAILADVLAPPFPDGAFAGVLLDAPCSGLGTLRAHPEIRWRRTSDDVARLAAVQRAMIARAARLVRPGGRLVYATCTLLRAENEDVVESLLAARPDFVRDDARTWLPAEAHDLVGPDGALRTSPDRGGLDGFFAARLLRVDDVAPGRGAP
ncbi:MAG: RsmB/NOP family class I SAM-dependent RNA methyltransferase, partial [Alphaproteobacteria bacterium]